MQSILFIGSDIDTRNDQIDQWIKEKQVSGSDIYRIDSVDSVKIDQIRGLSSYLYKKPFQGKCRAGVVYFANKLTIPAQNAFLKLLEEPPKTAYILLGARNKRQLLPTIVSRCLVVTLKQKDVKFKYKTEIKHILKYTHSMSVEYTPEMIKAVFEMAEKFGKDKSLAEEYLNELLLSLQEGFQREDNKKLAEQAQLVKRVNLAFSMLSVNVNPRQVLENLFL